ncbi:hypothetical protein ABFY57_00555 [Paenibacillus polymyxa]|uniref:hypothetical protein n=1 Tax=Paenibacillus polymyxa TaxID=1406 RepID=UPI003D2BAE66
MKTNLAVEVTLENQEWKTYIDTFKQKNFQIARMGWEGTSLIHLAYWDTILPKIRTTLPTGATRSTTN